jgi:hypothetical protein
MTERVEAQGCEGGTDAIDTESKAISIGNANGGSAYGQSAAERLWEFSCDNRLLAKKHDEREDRKK